MRLSPWICPLHVSPKYVFLFQCLLAMLQVSDALGASIVASAPAPTSPLLTQQDESPGPAPAEGKVDTATSALLATAPAADSFSQPSTQVTSVSQQPSMSQPNHLLGFGSITPLSHPSLDMTHLQERDNAGGLDSLAQDITGSSHPRGGFPEGFLDSSAAFVNPIFSPAGSAATPGFRDSLEVCHMHDHMRCYQAMQTLLTARHHHVHTCSNS